MSDERRPETFEDRRRIIWGAPLTESERDIARRVFTNGTPEEKQKWGNHLLEILEAQAALGDYRELHFVCDGPPSHESGRFVEVENAAGASVSAGEWRERDDGLWELVVRLPLERKEPNEDQ